MRHIVVKTLKGGLRSPFSFCLVAAALLLTGCRKDNRLGEEVQPDESLIGVQVKEDFTLIARTIPRDTVRTDERILILLGSYRDPDFGNVQTEYYTQLRLSSENVDFGNSNNLILDSAVLCFRYDNTRGGAYGRIKSDSSLDRQTFTVYELMEPLEIDSPYFGFSQAMRGMQPIGIFSNQQPNIRDSVSTITGREPPQLRIRMDSLWADQLLRAGPSVYASNESFQSYLNGLAIIPENPGQANGQGEIYYFNPTSTFTRMRMYYRIQTGPSEFDEETFDFLINDSTARFNRYVHDKMGTPAEMALNDAGVGTDKLYIQSLTGTAMELTIPDLTNIADNQPVVVNRAELILPMDPLQTEYAFNPAYIIQVYNESGRLGFLIDQVEGVSHINGLRDDFAREYRFNITRQVQSILTDHLAGINSNFGFVIFSGAEATSANRSVLQGTAPFSGERLKLRVIYTPL